LSLTEKDAFTGKAVDWDFKGRTLFTDHKNMGIFLGGKVAVLNLPHEMPVNMSGVSSDKEKRSETFPLNV
jgi:hypothetical protein